MTWKKSPNYLVKPTTINKELAALRSFCRWAHDMGWCEPVPIRRFPPKMTKAPLMDVPSAYSIESGRSFHPKAAMDSTGFRPLVPDDSGQAVGA